MEPDRKPCIDVNGADNHLQLMSLPSSLRSAPRRAANLIGRVAAGTASDHQRGDINEDDESSGPRCNWCGIGPCRSGSASPGAVVGKSRHRHCDPGRFEGLDDGSAVASALAPPLASPSLVNPSDTILTGPPPRARFLLAAP